jgi:hypothetical protein
MRKALLILLFALGVGVNCLASTNTAGKQTNEHLLKLFSATLPVFFGR